MSCKMTWDDEFIIANFTKKFFIEDLGTHRADALFERERALMPQTQERVQVMYIHEELAQFYKMVELYTRIRRPREVQRYTELIADRRAQLPTNDHGDNTTTQPKMTVAKPVCGCIRYDCRGFIMKDTWKCGMCATTVCKECLQEKTDAHVCTEDDKATRNALLHATKPCPQCAIMISRVEGCSQMWCTMCHTTFDWNTGEKVVNGMIHNPHYYEWVSHNTTQSHVNGAVDDIVRRLRSTGYYLSCVIEKIMNMHRLVRDLRYRIEPITPDVEADAFEELRFKYLTHELSEDHYKKSLVKCERRKKQKNAEAHVSGIFCEYVEEKLRIVYEQLPRLIKPHLMDIDALRINCNEQFKKIGRMYSSQYYVIPDSYSYVRKN